MAGVWERLFNELSADPDFEYVLIDSTICKAHADATGGRGDSGSRDRAFAWRPDDKDPRRGRCPRAPGAADPDGWPARRQPPGRRPDRRPRRCRPCHRRCGLRLWRPAREDRGRARGRGAYPGQSVPRNQAPPRPRPPRRTSQGRELLPADRALPPDRPALRENPHQLHGLRLPHPGPRLAQVNADRAWRATGVFGDSLKAEPEPATDVKTLHAKLGALTPENDFLS